jgi:hypothetical protein
MHNPPTTEGNFCDEHGNALKPQVALDCNQHMGYVDKGDRMANSYSIQWWTRKWAKRIFFPPVRHDNCDCEQLPPPDIIFFQNVTYVLLTCPSVKLD